MNRKYSSVLTDYRVSTIRHRIIFGTNFLLAIVLFEKTSIDFAIRNYKSGSFGLIDDKHIRKDEPILFVSGNEKQAVIKKTVKLLQRFFYDYLKLQF